MNKDGGAAFPCRLSKTGFCKYGGNKNFNYGFMRGSAAYCRLTKTFIHNWLVQKDIECPLNKKADAMLAEDAAHEKEGENER